ncbi:rcc01693 family protein [Parvibaculum sp.]|uniref:rcc01693 family protein n=1 Tax=Parvibaculum sp. TaxID=2024848 RepID=UPI00391C67F9
MSTPRFPWDEAMTLGLGRLRLTPEIFWRMTLPELAAAARALHPLRHTQMGRREIDALMARYPD